MASSSDTEWGGFSLEQTCHVLSGLSLQSDIRIYATVPWVATQPQMEPEACGGTWRSTRGVSVLSLAGPLAFLLGAHHCLYNWNSFPRVRCGWLLGHPVQTGLAPAPGGLLMPQ